MHERDLRFGLLSAAVLVLVATAVLAFGTDPSRMLGGDAGEYQRYATNLVDHGVYSLQEAPPYAPSIYRPPGYPVFLATLRVVGGESLLLVRVVQFMLLGVLAFLVYAIAQRLSDRRAARFGALLCLTYLPFVWLARMHMSEVVATVLVTLTVYTLMRTMRTPPPTLRQYAVVGVLLGFTGLVRPLFALAAGPILIGVLLQRPVHNQLNQADGSYPGRRRGAWHGCHTCALDNPELRAHRELRAVRWWRRHRGAGVRDAVRRHDWLQPR